MSGVKLRVTAETCYAITVSNQFAKNQCYKDNFRVIFCHAHLTQSNCLVKHFQPIRVIKTAFHWYAQTLGSMMQWWQFCIKSLLIDEPETKVGENISVIKKLFYTLQTFFVPPSSKAGKFSKSKVILCREQFPTFFAFDDRGSKESHSMTNFYHKMKFQTFFHSVERLIEKVIVAILMANVWTSLSSDPGSNPGQESNLTLQNELSIFTLNNKQENTAGMLSLFRHFLI